MKKLYIMLFLPGLLIAGVLLNSCSEDSFLEEQENVALKAKSVSMLSDLELLGKMIYFDKISIPGNMSCADCHSPSYGFTGPNGGSNLVSGIYHGAVASRFGNRKPPSAAYATFSPVLHYDTEEGLFIGGNFWDGRATGLTLGNPAAEQAIGPFLNPVEHNMPDAESVLRHISGSRYASLWKKVYGIMSFDDPMTINANYNKVGLAIAAYEASTEVNQFSSKFDFYLKGMARLTPEEEWGMELFNGKGLCNLCHISDGDNPLFTDFTFDNLGTPRNPENPFYRMDNVFLENGMPINPDGINWVDPGLGGFLATVPAWADMAAENIGKHKVPTLRNVDKKNGPGITKAYMHNGVFKSLKEVVHFYNTRDVEAWPEPEVPENVNMEELGNLGLTDAEENAIVAFMKTLSDGYKPGR